MLISNFKINDWGCDPLGHIWHRFIICISQFMTLNFVTHIENTYKSLPSVTKEMCQMKFFKCIMNICR